MQQKYYDHGEKGRNSDQIRLAEAEISRSAGRDCSFNKDSDDVRDERLKLSKRLTERPWNSPFLGFVFPS